MIGYFRIPRSLTRNTLWKDTSPTVKAIFLTILDHVVFKETKFDDHGVIINLLPGQFCAAQEEIAGLCGKKITKNHVQRGLVRLEKYGLLKHVVIHKKSVITITHPDTYELIYKGSDVVFDSMLSQTRSENDMERKNEMNKENEKNKFARTVSLPHNKSNEIFFSFDLREFQNITPEDFQRWKQIYPTVDIQREILKMIDWCLSHPTKAKSKKLWRKFISNWLSKANEEAINREAKFSSRNIPFVNRDISESHSSKTIDFSGAK